MNEAHGADFFAVSEDEMWERGAHRRHGRRGDSSCSTISCTPSAPAGPDGNALRDIAQGNHNSFNRPICG
jgi:hypothetical protein